MGGSALGLSPVLAGVMSGFSVGATQQATFNVVAGEAWYAGVAESAFIGAAAGGVTGGIVGAANPQSLPAKVLVGGVAGGGVGGGMKVATNVAAGRPWNEDLGQAIAIGATTGMVDAFTDYYGDKLVERAMTPRSARGAVDDVDAWRRPGAVDDADGRPGKLREAWDWVRGLPGDEQGSIRLGPRGAADEPRRVPSTGGRANEGRYRWAAGSVDAEGTKIGGRFAPGDAPDGARMRVAVGKELARPLLLTEWDSYTKRLLATTDFEYKGKHYRRGDVVPGEAVEGYIRYDEPSGEARRRVVKAIEGLYESIPADRGVLSQVLPEGWRIVGETSYLDDLRFKYIETMVEFANPETGEVASGIFQRGYYPEEGTLELKAAYLQDPRSGGEGSLPSWIDIGTSFPGREGVPTAAFFTMYQMRRMGVPYGGLEHVVWDNVVNVDTLLHVDWLGSKYPQASLESLVAHTHSVRYAETALTQSGHMIVPGSFEVRLPGYSPRDPLSSWRGAPPARYANIERYYGYHEYPGDTLVPALLRSIKAKVQRTSR